MSERAKGLNAAGEVTGSASGMSEYRPAPVPDYVPVPTDASAHRSVLVMVAMSVAALLGLLLLLFAVWIGVVQFKWLLLRRRLRSGSAAEQVGGAWHWLRLRWARSGYFEYANLTPDRISTLAAAGGDPTLATLAHAATQALYARQPDLDDDDAHEAWGSAETLRERAAGSWSHRLRALPVTPAAANRRLSKHQEELRLPPAKAEAGSLRQR